MLEVGAHDPGGRLGPEGPRLAVLRPRREPEELFLDDIGGLADTALEHGRLFEERRLDRLVPVAACEVAGETFETGKCGPFGGQQVARSPWRAI